MHEPYQFAEAARPKGMSWVRRDVFDWMWIESLDGCPWQDKCPFCRIRPPEFMSPLSGRRYHVGYMDMNLWCAISAKEWNDAVARGA